MRTKWKVGLGLVMLVIASGLAFYLFHKPGPPKLPNPPLKTLAAQHNLELGNFAISTHLNDPTYRNILTSQFNMALIDNTPNWYFTGYGGLRPSATTYNFSQMDQIVKFAEQNHMTIQAHHLLWGEQKWLPEWLKNGHYSPQQLLQIIHSDITTTVSRYRGQIAEWSVVNEAFSRNQHLYGLSDWWADHIKSQVYIDDAFTWAHQADPNAKLILNDFDDESLGRVSNAMFDYIKQAKARGVPIDGIGMQMHIDGTHPPTKDEVIANMQRFGRLGVQVYVTEFDVNMNDVKASDQQKDQTEASIYYDMMRACIESKVCHSFAILGITDAESWYNYLGINDARPLPFDKNYQPKPAFWSLRSALSQP